MVCNLSISGKERKNGHKELIKIPLLEKGADYTPSKWIHLSFFLAPDELKQLFDNFPHLLFFSLKNPQKKEEIIQDPTSFFSAYTEDVERFYVGEKTENIQKVLPLAITSDPSDLGVKPLSEGRCLLSIQKPLLLVRGHYFSISELDKKITSGKSIFWGIQISYPLIYIDPKTHQIQEGMKAPNAAFFTFLRKSIRKKSKYIFFSIAGEKVHCPYRISYKMIERLQQTPRALPNLMKIEE